MRTMQFTEENIREVLRLLAGILHAGNIEFMTAGGAQVSSKSGLTPGCPLVAAVLLTRRCEVVCFSSLASIRRSPLVAAMEQPAAFHDLLFALRWL